MREISSENLIKLLNFYRQIGLSESVYLNDSGIKDIYSVLGIEPKLDKNGKRESTPYEELGVAPVFRNNKEVPIVFAIKREIRGAFRKLAEPIEFTYVGAREQSKKDEMIANCKRMYNSAMQNGNLAEATKCYDIVDELSDGRAEEILGIYFNYIKFYKKMQRQLLIDIFANFFLLNLMKKSRIKQGIVKFDKIYKAFLKNIKKNNPDLMLGQGAGSPVMNNFVIDEVKGESDVVSDKEESGSQEVVQNKAQAVRTEAESENIAMYRAFLEAQAQAKQMEKEQAKLLEKLKVEAEQKKKEEKDKDTKKDGEKNKNDKKQEGNQEQSILENW